VFDTAIADSLVTRRHYNSSRNLAVVLKAWVGGAAAHLEFKGN
jgi:hypothetical protein